LFSVGAEEFALVSRTGGITLYMNNLTVAYDTGNNNVTNLPTNTWTHVVATWDTTADEYRIYFDGELIVSEATTTTDWADGGADLHLGGYDPLINYLGADCTMSQVVFWKTNISAAEAAQMASIKNSDAKRPALGTGKLFGVALGTSPIPTTGDQHYYYAHKGTHNWYYNDSTTSVAAMDRTTFPVDYALNGTSKGGFGFNAKTTNLCLQSEDLSTTWTTTGTASVTTNAGNAPDGNATADQVDGSAGSDSVQQDIGVAAASDQFVFSIYMNRSAGAGTPAIRLKDSINSEGTSFTITPSVSNGTWDRYDVHHSFTAGATGNVYAEIIVNDSSGSTYLFWGAQVEEVGEPSTTQPYQKRGTRYIKTAAATASSTISSLVYRAVDSINYEKGTAIFWAYKGVDNSTDFIIPNGPTLLGAPGQQYNFYLHELNGSLDFEYNSINSGAANTNSRNTWYHYAFTWDASSSPTVLKVYVNGALIYTDNGSTVDALTHRKFIIGVDYLHSSVDWWPGAIDTIDIYGSVKTLTEIDTDFDNTKASYGY